MLSRRDLEARGAEPLHLDGAGPGLAERARRPTDFLGSHGATISEAVPKKPKGARAERRAKDREAKKLAKDIERVAAFERGGAPDRPIRIASPSEVEVHARSTLCARCAGPTELLDHAAETIAGARLRVAHLRCKACGAARALYFELPGATLN